MSVNNTLKANLLLPPLFVKKWVNSSKQGEEKFQYLDFASEITTEINLDNTPYIQKMFSLDKSFDEWHIEKQFEQISKVINEIINVRVVNKYQIRLTQEEILFLKYFYFLISLINGDYKFYFPLKDKVCRSFDLFSDKLDEETKHDVLNIINYALFELYDSLFTSRPFSKLMQYVEETKINFTKHEYNKRIVVPEKDLEKQNYRFVDAYFHNLINNTFIKFFSINEIDKERFMLTNKTIANFIDDGTKLHMLGTMVVDPRYAIGLINMGPGRGEYRPMFKYFKEQKINTSIMPSCLIPEHKIDAEGVFLEEEQRYYFTPFELTSNQVKLVNECLTYRGLKYDVELFSKN